MLSRRILCSVLSLSLCLFPGQSLFAASPPSPVQWPKDLDNGDHRIEVYQHTGGGWQQAPQNSDVTNRLGQERQAREFGQQREAAQRGNFGEGFGGGGRRGGGGAHFHLRR